MISVFELRGFDAGEIAAERRLLEDTRRQRSVLLAYPLKTAECGSLLGIAMDRLRLAVALGEVQEADLALADACGWACATELGGRCAGGEITISADEAVYTAAADGTRLRPSQWIDALCLACIADEPGARTMFADVEMFTLSLSGPYTGSSPMTSEPFWKPYGCAIAALAAHDARAARYAREAITLLGASQRIDPQEFAAVDEPLLECVIALAEGVREGWGERILRGVEKFHAFYNRPDFDRLLVGYAPLGLMAIGALARERGIPIAIEHPGMRGDWIARAPTLSPIDVAAQVAGSARGATEIRWWLDLAGSPLSRRSHRLIEREGGVAAVYEASYGDRGPRIRGEFAISEEAAALLDAGELMLAAELQARRAKDETDRLYLQDATDALNELLAFIPAGASAVPAQAFWTSRGRAVRAQAPGRFERARIEAVRNEYARLLQPQGGHRTEEDARAGVLVWIEVIRAQLIELLERLPHEPEIVQALQPRDEDYEKVFAPGVVDRARAHYGSVWNAGPEVQAPLGASCVGGIYVAPAGMLGEDNELSRFFPGGYRSIAQWLQPHRVWVCWRYVGPGPESAISYDGLVWCDDHWAWFPKPYRALAQR